MLEMKAEDGGIQKEINGPIEASPEEADAPQQITERFEEEAAQSQHNESSETPMLNPLNETEVPVDTEAKGKQRRYWTPKEEERFFEIWGRENWRLTRHGKNTIYFAQWSDELKERHNIDVKPEEIQCKVNQTRAKFRSVKKLLEGGSNTQRWKKYDLVEKILRNQYRSKDDEPVPLDALENNRDMSPTELLNCETRTSSPNGLASTEHEINLSQPTGDSQLADDVNMSNISLSDQNLTSNVFCNNSQTSTSFSTELFGGDQLDIKKEIETDLIHEGYTEITSSEPSETTIGDVGKNNLQNPIPPTQDQQQQTPNSQQTSSAMMNQQNLMDNSNNVDGQQHNRFISNLTTLPNHQNQMGTSNNLDAIGTALNQNHGAVPYNHVAAGSMQPPKSAAPIAPIPSPRKRNTSAKTQAAAHTSSPQDALENLYLEEVRKKNVLLVEQGEINRKRLRLEERKVKLMEDFFPKYLTLQQEILQKLDNVRKTAPEAPNNIKMEE